MDAVFALTVAILAFGGLGAAFAWVEFQERAPRKLSAVKLVLHDLDSRQSRCCARAGVAMRPPRGSLERHTR